ncbi:PhlD [Streptomyces lonarensis]|uniref:PhlD n=1 Tax=Streptomyces lonarensis TaxID=700599 RepID=A0A7X6I0U9_9ACTN|nr:PhlD [Streptomyces lonarensis]NJQ07890.1 PhlD [Streptomyces lonarensis]
MPSITMPAVRYAPHWVSTDELAATYRLHHPDHPRLATWMRMVRSTGVEKRPWLRPPASTGAADGVGPRSRTAYGAARDLAVTAGRDALAAAGLRPCDIDAVVTSHTSSYTVPGLEVDLVRRLGLRPDVSRVGLATAACAGGAHALTQAARIARDLPDAAVLVVVSEALSTLFHPSGELSLQQVLYSGLFGDAAGAVVVTGDAAPLAGRRVQVGEAWEYLLPDSEDAYWGVIDQPGIRFDSGARSRTAPGQVGPALGEWLARGPAPQWAVVHPGGPGIISTTLEAIGMGPEDGRHARDSLAEAGNLGGVAVLDVLSRTLAAPVPPTGPGLLVAHGPGFTTTALRLDGAPV